MNNLSKQNFGDLEKQNVYSDVRISKDPFLFTNRIIRDRIKEERLNDLIIPLGFHAMLNVFLQPFNVIGTLLQLSVKEHANLYNTPTANSLNGIQDFAARPIL